MRTKAEIENNLKEWEDRLKKTVDNKVIISEHYENDRNNKINFYEGIIDCLKWVLEEPKYKRTIFELTDEEVQKLIKIIDPFSKDKIKEIKQFERPNSKGIHIILDGLDNEWTIYNDLDVHYWRVKRSPNNICQFIDTIREMLSMEKPE